VSSVSEQLGVVDREREPGTVPEVATEVLRVAGGDELVERYWPTMVGFARYPWSDRYLWVVAVEMVGAAERNGEVPPGTAAAARAAAT
jgi:hypothetical protein